MTITKFPEWQPINTAPEDVDVLVWYDHDADPYNNPEIEGLLTNYAMWAEDSGAFYSFSGMCIARLFPSEIIDEDYMTGDGIHMPPVWRALHDSDYACVVNALYWMPLPDKPDQA